MRNVKLNRKKVDTIANFIVNNITYAEASTIIIEKATETAEYIVEHSLDPNNFKSPTARKKLQRKISELKNGVVKIKQTRKRNPKIRFKEDGLMKNNENKKSWLERMLIKIGFKKEVKEIKEKEKQKDHRGFTTHGE